MCKLLIFFLKLFCFLKKISNTIFCFTVKINITISIEKRKADNRNGNDKN